MNDFSLLYPNKTYASKKQEMNIKGRFSVENFKANQDRYASFEVYQLALEEGTHLWDIQWLSDRYDEDNDTEESTEEESSSEEE